METLQLTKFQARQAVNTWKYAQEDLSHKDLNYVERQAATYNEKYDNIKEENNVYIWIRKSNDNVYELAIDTSDHTKMDVYDKVSINGKVFTIGYLLGFLNDLTDLEQRKVLEDFYVGGIENYLEKRCGHPITLKKFVTNPKGKYQMDLYTDNLVNETGICKAMLKNIYIECRNIGFYVDYEYTGEQKLSYMRFNFRYEHQDGGSNGHEIGVVRQNKNGELEGYNYETGKYEVL